MAFLERAAWAAILPAGSSQAATAQDIQKFNARCHDWLARVERGPDGGPMRLRVSGWSRPGRYLDEACIVTENFGTLSAGWVDAAQPTRFRRP